MALTDNEIKKLSHLANNKTLKNENMLRPLNISIFAFTILMIIIILK